MTNVRTILPPNATKLERAVDQSAPLWGDLAAAARPGADAYLGEHPAAFLPWLAAEWGLADLARHFATTQALVDAGLPWLKERGTPAAVLRALGWIGFANARLDADGPWLHIDLGRTATTEELTDIAHVVRASIPAHVNFYRVYFAWDLRAITLDGSTRLDSGIIDNESGAWVDIVGDEPIKVSFGLRHSKQLASPLGQPLRRAYSVRRATPQDLEVGALDVQRLDSPVRPNIFGGGTVVRPVLLPQAAPPGQPLRRSVPTTRRVLPPLAPEAPRHIVRVTRRAVAPHLLPLEPTWDTADSWPDVPWDYTPILSRSMETP